MGFKKQFFGLFPGNKQKKKDELKGISDHQVVMATRKEILIKKSYSQI